MCDYYPDADRARVFINSLAVPSDYLEFHAAPKTMWFKLLSEIRKHTTFRAVLEQVKQDYPHQDWTHVEPSILAPTSLATPFAIPTDNWHGLDSKSSLEKIIGTQSTLLPISFLENGIEASRSVAKITIPSVGSGSGFLIENNILLTNHHVLQSEQVAQTAELLFNYQLTRDGRDATTSSFGLSPNILFLTSKEDDWTAVRVAGEANKAWGNLKLATDPVKKDEPVNIIQHPGGQPKQIAIYHNLVQFAGPSSVQYLTDTMAGSSGSPVFNSQWLVVALHRAGGMVREPNSPSLRQYYRNEGTPIELIRRRLIDEGVI